ncbi:MAG: hypothetical protein RLN62_04235 [Rickettsiales bacterium]
MPKSFEEICRDCGFPEAVLSDEGIELNSVRGFPFLYVERLAFNLFENKIVEGEVTIRNAATGFVLGCVFTEDGELQYNLSAEEAEAAGLIGAEEEFREDIVGEGEGGAAWGGGIGGGEEEGKESDNEGKDGDGSGRYEVVLPDAVLGDGRDALIASFLAGGFATHPVD